MNPLRTTEEIVAEYEVLNVRLAAAARELEDAYRHIFSGKEGQLVIGDLMGKFGWGKRCVEQSLFSESHAQMAFREGQRDVVRHILWQLKKRG